MSLIFSAVIFDWGGVFQQTADYTPRHRWDDRLGFPHGTIEARMFNSDTWRDTQLGLLSTDEHWQRFGRSLGLSAKDADQLQSDFFAGDVISESVKKIARRLKLAGVPTALMSNNYRELDQHIEAIGCGPLFDALIISACIGVMKPDPAAYYPALKAVKVIPAETVFVDDNAVNVDAAKAMGMQTILYTKNANLEQIFFG